MFDIGFGELLLIAVVALVVLGPERLPGAARTVGALLRRLRSGWASVRDEVERELQAEELKRNLNEAREQARAAEERMREDMRRAGEDVRRTADEVRAAARDEGKGDDGR